jgi:hypothetical protein
MMDFAQQVDSKSHCAAAAKYMTNIAISINDASALLW